MILRLSSTVGRGIVAVIAVASFVFLAFFGVRDALAVYFLGQQTFAGISRATRLEPADPDNWYALGRFWQFNLENSDSERAIAAYRRALELNPQYAAVWLDLASSYETLGRTAEAAGAFESARRVYPLSAQVAWSYGNFLLRQGDLDAAFAEIRRAVVADPRRGAEAFSVCSRVEPDLEKLLDRIIPPSRDVYLDVIHVLTDANEPSKALQVWDRLVALDPQLQLRSIHQLIDLLRRNHQTEEASRVWAQAAAFAGYAGLDPPNSVLWDGGFETGETGFDYAWTFSPNAHGVTIGPQSQEKHSGSEALRVTFDGHSNPNFQDVCHSVPLQAVTSYQFSAWVRARDLSSDQGLHFVLSGLGGSTASPPLITKDMLGSFDWQQVTGEWTKPEGALEAQVCLARFPSDQPDNKIRGTLWLDDVSLTPKAVETSPL
jgi:tetratricopeptide (TPR) repeat protein